MTRCSSSTFALARWKVPSCWMSVSASLALPDDIVWENAEATHSLLCQLTGTLVFAVAEQFDNPAFVGCQTRRERELSAMCWPLRKPGEHRRDRETEKENGMARQVTALNKRCRTRPTATKPRLPSPTVRRRTESTHPATSFTISRTKAVRFDWWPLVREILGFMVLGVVCTMANTPNRSASVVCNFFLFYFRRLNPQRSRSFAQRPSTR